MAAWDDVQLASSVLAASIKQYRFRKEKEIRYIHVYPIVFETGNDGSINDNPLPPRDVSNATEHEFVEFDKSVLCGVVLGKNVSFEDKNKIEAHLKDNGYDVYVKYRNENSVK